MLGFGILNLTYFSLFSCGEPRGVEGLSFHGPTGGPPAGERD